MRRCLTVAALFFIPLGLLIWFVGRPMAHEEKGFDLLPWLGLLFDVFSKVDWLNALLAIGGFFILGLLAFWQITPGDGFDLRELVCDLVTHADGRSKWKVRPGKMFQTGAFVVTTWQMFKLTVANGLTPEYLILYAALWAASPVMNRWAQNKFPVGADNPPIEPLPPVPAGPVTTVSTKTKVSTT